MIACIDKVDHGLFILEFSLFVIKDCFWRLFNGNNIMVANFLREGRDGVGGWDQSWYIPFTPSRIITFMCLLGAEKCHNTVDFSRKGGGGSVL